MLDMRSDYGRRSAGSWHSRGEFWELRGKDLIVRWWGAADAELARVDGHRRLELTFNLQAGEQRDLVLDVMTTRSPLARSPEMPDAESLWRLTEETWRESVPDCAQMVAARDVRRSYAVLRGLTSPEGGTVAAVTTSLPERARGKPQLRLPLFMGPRHLLCRSRRSFGGRRRAHAR